MDARDRSTGDRAGILMPWRRPSESLSNGCPKRVRKSLCRSERTFSATFVRALALGPRRRVLRSSGPHQQHFELRAVVGAVVVAPRELVQVTLEPLARHGVVGAPDAVLVEAEKAFD